MIFIPLTFSDFVTSRLSGFDGGPDLDWTKDDTGHGTHVSGTIAAARNGIGVIGVAPDAEVYTVRVFDGNGRFAYGRFFLPLRQFCIRLRCAHSLSLCQDLRSSRPYRNVLTRGSISFR